MSTLKRYLISTIMNRNGTDYVHSVIVVADDEEAAGISALGHGVKV